MNRISFGTWWYYAKQDAWFFPCLCLAPLMLCAALFALIFLRETEKFDTRGVATKGVVTQVEGNFRTGGKSFDEVYYRYTAKDGGSFKGSQKVGNRGSQYPVGKAVDVDYLPEDPSQNRMRDPEAAGPAFLWIFLWVGLGLGVLGFVGVVWGWLGIARHIRLLHEGTPVVGRVVEHPRKRKGAGTTEEYRFRYAYTDPTGHEREADSPPIPRTTKGKWEEGTSVVVVFHPDLPLGFELDIQGLRESEIVPD